jgi:hypothetical protein
LYRKWLLNVLVISGFRHWIHDNSRAWSVFTAYNGGIINSLNFARPLNQKMKTTSIKISSSVLFQELSGETVLLDLDSESYFGLDAIGTRIWQLLSEGQEVSTVVDALLQEYEVEREELERDVSELLERLSTAGLIEIA